MTPLLISSFRLESGLKACNNYVLLLLINSHEIRMTRHLCVVVGGVAELVGVEFVPTSNILVTTSTVEGMGGGWGLWLAAGNNGN